MKKPILKPKFPYFSSGPCKKPSNWNLHALQQAIIGRSHRSKIALQKIQQAMSLTRKLLNIPADYYIAIVPASDTGAVEMAMWNLLGYKDVDILIYEHFAQEWFIDLSQQLKIAKINSFIAPFGNLPDLKQLNFDNDFLFVLNGTTLGMALSNLDFIPKKRNGLVICDASAAAFSRELDFSKLDVTTFSWQKSLGGEGAHGIIILSPKALQRLENYNPSWPIPKIFRLKNQKGNINYNLFNGEVLNTPSMLCIEDYICSLLWVESLGGVKSLINRIDKNIKVINNFVTKSNWLDYLIPNPSIRATTTQTLTIIDKDFLALTSDMQKLFLKNMLNYLESEHVAYDISSYRKAPVGLRIWTGPTVEENDLKLLCEWLDFAFFAEKAKINYKYI